MISIIALTGCQTIQKDKSKFGKKFKHNEPLIKTDVKALGKDSKFAFVNAIKQPGTKYANELLDSALKDFRSPEAMERLHQILGGEMFGRVMKAKLIDSFQNSFTKWKTNLSELFRVFNVFRLKNQLYFKKFS